jgi:hypothetical protein
MWKQNLVIALVLIVMNVDDISKKKSTTTHNMNLSIRPFTTQNDCRFPISKTISATSQSQSPSMLQFLRTTTTMKPHPKLFSSQHPPTPSLPQAHSPKKREDILYHGISLPSYDRNLPPAESLVALSAFEERERERIR